MLACEPKFGGFLFGKAASLALSGHMDEARHVCARVLELEPGFSMRTTRQLGYAPAIEALWLLAVRLLDVPKRSGACGLRVARALRGTASTGKRRKGPGKPAVCQALPRGPLLAQFRRSLGELECSLPVRFRPRSPIARGRHGVGFDPGVRRPPTSRSSGARHLPIAPTPSDVRQSNRRRSPSPLVGEGRDGGSR